jgi:hypothetical protein
MKAFQHSVLMRTSFLLVAMWAIGACDVLLAQDKHINVAVNGNKLVFQNSECPDRPNEMGCVLVERGNAPMISWELGGPGSEGWTLSALKFNPVPLQQCTVDDFGLSDADRQTGSASTAQIVSNGKRLQIRDRNRNVCESQYTLIAVSSDGRQIDSDPVIRNGGGL